MNPRSKGRIAGIPAQGGGGLCPLEGHTYIVKGIRVTEPPGSRASPPPSPGSLSSPPFLHERRTLRHAPGEAP